MLVGVKENNIVSKVLRGENRKRTLKHESVVRLLQSVVRLLQTVSTLVPSTKDGRYSFETKIPMKQDWKRRELELFCILQNEAGRISEATERKL